WSFAVLPPNDHRLPSGIPVGCNRSSHSPTSSPSCFSLLRRRTGLRNGFPGHAARNADDAGFLQRNEWSGAISGPKSSRDNPEPVEAIAGGEWVEPAGKVAL